MKDDLISRQAAIDALEDAGMTNYLATGDFYGIINALTVIKNIPAVEKNGKWIVQINGWGDVYFECSCCKEAVTLIDGSPKDNHYYYCPHCGARMEE